MKRNDGQSIDIPLPLSINGNEKFADKEQVRKVGQDAQSKTKACAVITASFL